jgi:hypothetical protein
MSHRDRRQGKAMDNKTALHTAARRYCQDRFSEWMENYKQLQNKEGRKKENLFQPGWDYSDEAWRVFPRYRVATAIQVEVERLVPDSRSTFGELRSKLIAACDVAEARLREELKKTIAREALHEEADDYRAYIQVLGESDLANLLPLPFRRVLAQEESRKLWSELEKAWGIGGGSWFPLKEGIVPPNVITFHSDYFGMMGGAQLLREALGTRGIAKIYLLHEFAPLEPDYEVECPIAEPTYGSGGEQYCTSGSAEWVVYASHESSITVCGEWLTTIFKQKWPDWNQRSYRGPYSTEDLIGTWETA